MGYRPSHSAVSLARGSTHSIGLVLPDVSRWFFAKSVEIIEQSLRTKDYDALIYSLPDYLGERRHRFNPAVLQGKVDAMLVLSLFFSEEEVSMLKTMKVPAAFLSVAQPGFSHVGIDDEKAAEKATEYLISLGHHVIGHLSGMNNDQSLNAPTQRRRNGWKNTLHRHQLEDESSLDEPAKIMTAKEGYTAMNMLLDRRPDITGVVASSDEIAMGAIHALHSRGLTVGRDISVVGIDGNDLSEVFDLTTVEQPIEEEGRQLVRIIMRLVHGDGPIHNCVLPTTLAIRGSSGPPVR
jgi:DNA-binding LacI/PurR family transcriptional regulator